MRTEIRLEQEPQNGIYVMVEGLVVTVFFDLEFESVRNIYTGEAVISKGRGYKDILTAIIVDKYDSNDTQAILANYTDALHDEDLDEEKKHQYTDEYNVYQAYRVKAKNIANKVIEYINGLS